jgi:uncharacterized membrane protein SpoIIM required for sporulation
VSSHTPTAARSARRSVDAAPVALCAVTLRDRSSAWIRGGTAGIYVGAVLLGAAIAPLHLPLPANPVQLTWWGVARNNLAVVSLIILGGSMLAVPTVAIGAFNGFMSGALLAALAGTPAWWIATLIHGLPEALGQWCAMVAGVELAFWLYRWLRRGAMGSPALAARWAAAAALLTCGAAALEAYVSPAVARALL